MAGHSQPDNPFLTGAVVTGEDFADRQAELAFLREELLAGGRVFLLAYRRYGKSCLIHECLRQIRVKNRVGTAYLDLYRINSERGLWEAFVSQVLAAGGGPGAQVVEWASKWIRALSPRFSVDPRTGEFAVTFGAPRTPADLEELRAQALELPARLTKDRKARLVIAFDEFQEIRTLNGTRLEKTLRAAFQTHRQVGYLFAGSKPHLLREMTEDPEAAFYRFGRILDLGSIEEAAFASYLERRFRRGKIALDPGVLPAVYRAADGVPYYVIWLCRVLWQLGLRRRSLKPAHVDEAVSQLLAESQHFFIATWDRLTLAQRRLLGALAGGHDSDLFAEEVRQQHELGPSSSVAKNLERLRDLGVVAREARQKAPGHIYRVVDPMFTLWVRQQTAQR